MNLLIVDDEKIIREGIRGLLANERPSITVFLAQNATEAMDCIRSKHIDAMLLDIQLHKVDGLTLLKQVHQEGYYPMTAIISGYENFEYARVAMSENAMEYLLKPVPPQKVLQLVDRFLGLSSEHENVDDVIDDTKDGKNFLVESIIDYVKHSYQKPINIAIIANSLGYSANYIGKLFNCEMGMSITQYVCEYRINKAKKLLLETALKINDIADMVGYHDTTYFVSTFKKMTGKTPGEYRQAKS